MSDYGTVLERVERRVRMPEPAMERMLQRRDRRARNQRIEAAVVGLVVALAGIGFGVLALRGGRVGRPASGEAPSPPPGGEGIVGMVLPTVAIWIALAVLGLTGLAIVRLRRRPAEASARGSTRRARSGQGHGPATETGTARAKGGNEMDSRQKTGAGIPRTEMPEIRFDDGRLRRTNLWLIGAVVALAVALVVVGPRAIFDRSDGRTVTHTAYTTSRDVQSRITFDGSTCAYSGPAEVASGTRVVFDYTAAEGLESAMAVIRAPDKTYEDMLQVATRDADDPPSWAVPNWNSEPAGAPHQSLTMTLGEGLWAIVCLTSPETTNDVVLGTMIRAVAA